MSPRGRQLNSFRKRSVCLVRASRRRDLNVMQSRGVLRIFAIVVSTYDRTLEEHALVDFSGVLQRALDRYSGAGLTVLAVDYQQTDANGMQAFLHKVGARFPAVYDPAAQIAGEYGVSVGLPVSIFIDRSGKVEFIQLGQMSDAVLQQHLHSIL